MQRLTRRVVALLALAAGTAAGFLAVQSALNAPASGVEAARATVTAHTTSFGPSSVLVTTHSTGIVCYRVIEPYGSSHACRPRVRPSEIGFAVSPRGIGGVAGSQVSAVIIKFTRRGTRWATLRDGVFYADVPSPYRVRAVVKMLRDGTRKRFAVTPSP
jgi:hypothetical protein